MIRFSFGFGNLSLGKTGALETPAPVHLELKPLCSPNPNPNPFTCFIYQVNRQLPDCTSRASSSEDTASLASQTTANSAPPSHVHSEAIGKIIPKANSLKRQCSPLLQKLDECESEPEEEQTPRLSVRIEPTPDGHAPSSIKTEHQELATPEMMPCEIATPYMQPQWPVKQKQDAQLAVSEKRTHERGHGTIY